MQEVLNHIINNYLNVKQEKFRENILARYIRETAVKNIIAKVNIDMSKYKIEGSPGKGRWADVPWIAILDKDITESATKGYYIVYIFRSDMSGVYISLNQGWTYFKHKYGRKQGTQKIKLVSSVWKNILSSTLSDFSFDSIGLKSTSKNSDLPEGYELGNICGKFYPANKIPNDIKLAEDLINLIGVYRELKGKLIENSIEKTNNHFIVNYNLGLIDDKSNSEDLNDIENLIESKGINSLLIKEDPPSNFSNNESDDVEFTGRKTNFLRKNKRNKKVGLAGELMVLNYEKQNLIKNGNEKLSQKVKHVSQEIGDGMGYDILSFEGDGSKKYIEVKTTTESKSTPFIITDREAKFSQKNRCNYYLYRIFEFNKKSSKGKLFILKGNIFQKLKLKPREYIVNGYIDIHEK